MQFVTVAEFEVGAGGIFLWVKFPKEVDTSRLAQAGLQSGVAVNPGVEWIADTEAAARWVRICFAHPSERVIRDGVARLAEVCHREFGVPEQLARVHR
jgi:2-aminoadipate transaminase